MKKKKLVVLGAIAALLISVAMVWQDAKGGSIFDANVEALTETEQSPYKKCYRKILRDPFDEVCYCGECSILPGRPFGGMDFCK